MKGGSNGVIGGPRNDYDKSYCGNYVFGKAQCLERPISKNKNQSGIKSVLPSVDSSA